jgi:hypothetical protein
MDAVGIRGCVSRWAGFCEFHTAGFLGLPGGVVGHDPFETYLREWAQLSIA